MKPTSNKFIAHLIVVDMYNIQCDVAEEEDSRQPAFMFVASSILLLLLRLRSRALRLRSRALHALRLRPAFIAITKTMKKPWPSSIHALFTSIFTQGWAAGISITPHHVLESSLCPCLSLNPFTCTHNIKRIIIIITLIHENIKLILSICSRFWERLKQTAAAIGFEAAPLLLWMYPHPYPVLSLSLLSDAPIQYGFDFFLLLFSPIFIFFFFFFEKVIDTASLVCEDYMRCPGRLPRTPSHVVWYVHSHFPSSFYLRLSSSASLSLPPSLSALYARVSQYQSCICLSSVQVGCWYPEMLFPVLLLSPPPSPSSVSLLFLPSLLVTVLELIFSSG